MVIKNETSRGSIFLSCVLMVSLQLESFLKPVKNQSCSSNIKNKTVVTFTKQEILGRVALLLNDL